MDSEARARRQTVTGGRPASGGYIAGSVALAVGKPTAEAPKGFRWVALTDLARLETGHTPSRKVPAYWNGSIPWIGIRDATGNHGRTITATREYITEEGEAHSSARLLPAKTVCLSRTASVGYVVVMGVPMATSQDFVNWVCGPDLDHRYLKYVLLAEHDSVLRFASGTTHQTIYFPEVKAFYACLPEIAEQRAIADVLGALDDKIESNRRGIDIMSAFVSALFKARCATTGEQVPLTEYATFHKGVSYRSADLQPGPMAMVTLKCFQRDGSYSGEGLKPYIGDFKAEQEILPAEVAVAQTDLTQAAEVVGRAVRVPRSPRFERLVASLDLAIIRPREATSNEFIYGLLVQDEFREHCRARVNGTTVLHLPKDALPSYLSPLVPPSAREAFVREARPVLERRDLVLEENETMAALRDCLLPELLSGRLRVKDAMKSAEEVT